MSTQQSLGKFGLELVDEPEQEFDHDGLDTDARELLERWGVTPKQLEKRARSNVTEATGPRERVCEECGARVTETKHMGEVGHKWGERPSEDRCSQSQRGAHDE